MQEGVLRIQSIILSLDLLLKRHYIDGNLEEAVPDFFFDIHLSGKGPDAV